MSETLPRNEERVFSELQRSHESLEIQESLPAPLSHEASRLFFKERGLHDTEENRRALLEYAGSKEYRESKRFQAATSFESYLRFDPLEVRVPNDRGGVDAASPFAARFTELVLREKAYAAPGEKMDKVLNAARDVCSRGKLQKFSHEQIAAFEPWRAEKYAFEAAIDWARRMEEPRGAADPLFLSLLETEARFALRAEERDFSHDALKEKTREEIKERIDALSFMRGYLREVSEAMLQRLDEQLAALGFEVDGFCTYYDTKDSRESKIGGDLDAFLDGEHLAQILKQEKETEERVAREKRSGGVLKREVEELLDHEGPTELDLKAAEAEYDTLLAHRDERVARLRDLQKSGSWLGPLRRFVNPGLAEKIEVANGLVVEASAAAADKFKEIEAMKEVMAKKSDRK